MMGRRVVPSTYNEQLKRHMQGYCRWETINMHSIKSQVFPQQAYATLGVKVGQVAANVLTTACNLARYAAEEPNVDIAAVGDIMSRTAYRYTDWWTFLTTETTDAKAGTTVKVMESSLILADALGNKDALSQVSKTMKKYLGSLLAPPVIRDDLGSCLFADLTAKGMPFSAAECIMAATGWNRQYATCTTKFPGMQDMFTVPHYASGFVSEWANFFFRMDHHRLNFGMFSPPNELAGGIERKDPWAGGAAALMYIARRLYVFGVLYRVAAMRLAWGVNKRLRPLARSLYLNRLPHPRADIIMIEEAFDAAMNDLPTHPFATYIESLLSSGKIECEQGLLDALFFDLDTTTIGGRATDPKHQLKDGPNCDMTSFLPLIYEDYLRTSVALRSTSSACSVREWGIMESETGKFASATMTPLELVTLLRADPKLIDDLRSMASELGWGTISGVIGTIETNGCDFALTDGIHCTVEPEQVMAGFTPLLAASNTNLRGVTFRVMEEFKPETQHFSALPINGRVDVMTANVHLERQFIPYGMTMGEEGLTSINIAGIGSDPTATAIVSYFTSKIAAYPDMMYTPPRRVPPAHPTPDLKMITWTAWGSYGVSSVNEQEVVRLKKQWIESLGKEAVTASDLVLAAREGGQVFYGRCIVELTRADEINLYNAIGSRIKAIPFRSFVVFDNDETYKYDFKTLDKLLTLFPGERSSSAAPQLTPEQLASASELKV